MSTILPHMVWLSANLECMSEMHCTRLAENAGRKKSPPYRQSEKNLLNTDTSSTCPHTTVNVGLLTAEICWRVWGTLQISTAFASWQRCCTAL